MRIKELHIKDYNVIREADFQDLSNFVVVAGPNGVGKTYLKNAIVHIFQNNGNPPTGSKVVLQATSNEEKETWGKNEFNLPYNTFWQLLTKKRKKLKTRTRLIQIDSNREIETIQFQEMTFSQIGDPEQDEIDYSHGLSNIKDRFQDVCRTLHRLKSRMVKDVYTSYRQNIGSQEQVTVEKLADPTAKFEELFYRILYPKKMKTIEVESRTIQFFDEDGTVRPVNVLSSGEKEAVVLAFDLTLQNPSDCIILIDEPELHLHPELTFRLLKVLKAIGDRNQFFLFTHSADIIGNSFDTGIHFIRPKSKVQGNQVIRVDRDNIGELKLIPNLKDTIGMLSLGKKLLFVEGKNISIDRNVFSTIAKSSQLDIAIIPSDGCSNINNMSLLCETLEKGVFGIELYMVRDKDSLTEEQIQNFTTKSKGKLIFLPFYHIENTFLVPAAIHQIAQKLELTTLPSIAEIEAKMVELAKDQINHCITNYVKNEIYFKAGNFDVSPGITLNESTPVTDIKSGIVTKRDQLLMNYTSNFSDTHIETRLNYWKNKLDNSLINGWSDEARQYFFGKRLMIELQNWLIGTQKINLWEHIINDDSQVCQDTIKPLKDILEKV